MTEKYQDTVEAMKKVDTPFLAALVSLLDDEDVRDERSNLVRVELKRRRAAADAMNTYTTVGGARGLAAFAPRG